MAVGLFPRYEGKFVAPGAPSFTTDLGYHFLYDPPSKRYAHSRIAQESEISMVAVSQDLFEVKPMLDTVFLTWGVILLVTIGNVALLSETRKERK